LRVDRLGVFAALAGDDDVAAFSVRSFLPKAAIAAGKGPPEALVEKNTGSISAKSPSARMRSIRTEPTMPRQPTRPTRGFDESAI
jgi:hypothetical protein